MTEINDACSTCRIVLPDDANMYGNCHGGTTLKMIEQAGFVAAAQFCNCPKELASGSGSCPPSAAPQKANTILPVVAHVSSVAFHEPLFVGELAKLYATPTFASPHTVEVLVEVWAENLLRSHARKTNTALLTYVATDPQQQVGNKCAPCVVPTLTPGSEEGKARYAQGEERYRARKQALQQDNGQSLLLPANSSSPKTLTLVQVMQPSDCWFGKIVAGGTIMKLMDNAAGAVAARHCKAPAVTVSIDELKFKHPVALGDVVYVHATPVFASAKSLEILVKVEYSRLGEDSSTPRTLTTCGRFTFVALDSSGRSTTVPPLVPETPAEKEAFEAAKQAYERRKSQRKPPKA